MLSTCNYRSNMVVRCLLLSQGGLSFPVVQSSLADVALQTTKPQASPMEYFFGRRRKCNTTEHSSPTAENGVLTHTRESPVPFRELLVAPVLVAAGSYASFALIDMAFRTVLPVYLSTPITVGGLGLDPSAIGTILAVVGTGNGVCQLFLLARLHDWLGAKNLFLATTLSYLPVIALLPIINWVAQAHGLNGLVWLLLGIQMLLSIFANFAFCKKPSTFPCLVPVTNVYEFLRCHFHIHQRFSAKPSFDWSNQWDRPDACISHACHCSSSCQFRVFTEHPEACYGGLFCILVDGGDGRYHVDHGVLSFPQPRARLNQLGMRTPRSDWYIKPTQARSIC